MALDAEEQALFDWAVAALPRWFTSDERVREELTGIAKMFGDVRAIVVYWFAQALISGAVGPATGLPDWLNQHAIDRGTRRQSGETDEALRIRLRNTPDALTRATLLSAAQVILEADGVSGTAAMVELPRDGAHSGSYLSMTGTGGTFTARVAGVQGFAPDEGWATPPVDSNSGGWPWTKWRLSTAGASDPDNDFTDLPIEGTGDNPDIVGNFAQLIRFFAGVAAVDPTVSWTAKKLKMHSSSEIADGRARAYSRRGYRSARPRPPVIIAILPYGTTAGTAASVLEMLRQKKAAGVIAKVERRTSPP